MANYNSLKATIDAQIKANGNQEITGPILNAVLTAMINTIGNGYTLQGTVAQTTDNPGSPDNPVAYIAAGPGTYTNFGATVIPDDGHAYMLTWDTTWTAVQLPFPTQAAVAALALVVTDKQDKDTGDTAGHVAVMDGNGNSEDGGVPLADLATKEDVEAVEQEVAQVAGEAGLAEAVIDTDGAGTEQEFTFRKSGGDGGAYYRKIKGKTLAWNQLVYNFNSWGGANGSVSYSNNILTYTVTDVVGGAAQYAGDLGTQDAVAGHKYYIGIYAMLEHAGNIYIGGYAALLSNRNFDIPAANVWTKKSYIAEASSSFSGENLYFSLDSYTTGTIAVGDKMYLKMVRRVDLTQMFGAGNEPTSVAEFEALYPDTYYPYTPGTLISNDAEAVETTGRNQYNPATGKARVIGGQTYYIGGTYTSLSQDGVVITPAGDGTFTPASTGEVDVVGGNATDTIINLSDADNGLWQPYWKRTLQLGITTRKDTDGNVPFPNGLQSCPVAQDEATKEGGTIRVGTRAYQAGDESDANVITDGTNTNYALATPVPFTWAEPLNLGVKVDENGTEKAVAPEGATAPSAPFVADTTYTMSIARMVAKLQSI